MPVTITEKAAAEVKRILEGQKMPAETGLRVAVRGGGCSGFSYSLSFEPKSVEGDQVQEVGGVKIFCDPKSFLYLDGTTIDWQDSLNGRGFVFQNPNAKHSCGCGESFSV